MINEREMKEKRAKKSIKSKREVRREYRARVERSYSPCRGRNTVDRSGGRTDDERTCENVTLLLVFAPLGRGTKDVEKRVPRNSPISRGLSTEREKAVAEKTPRLSPSFEPLFFLSQLPAQRSYLPVLYHISSAPLKKHTRTHYLSFSLYFLFFFVHVCFIFSSCICTFSFFFPPSSFLSSSSSSLSHASSLSFSLFLLRYLSSLASLALYACLT